MSQASITIFSTEAAVVCYTDKKNNAHSISVEGALFKGGAALAALKDVALDAALTKAANGRFRAAADILGAAFPKVAKAAEAFIGAPWSNKTTMLAFISAVERAEPGKSGYTKKQSDARLLLGALRQLTPFKAEENTGEVVENAA